MSLLLANNATSFLAAGISNSDTSLTVRTGDGAKFPAPSPGDWFPLTIVRSDSSLEIVRCTARTADTFTIERAQEGTAALEFNAGDRVELRATAGAFEEFRQEVDDEIQSIQDILDGLGTAATRDVTTDPTDTTSGRVLTVGSMGLGGSSMTYVSPNVYPRGGFISTELTESEAVSLGFPALGGSPNTPRHWGTITHGRGNRITQIATEVFGNGTTRGRTFVRVKHDATWHPWQEIYHSGNTDASRINYLPVGTGAVTRTVQDKLRETVSVKDFGAVGDGVADDTAAIQAAINYAAATRGSVFVPPGKYKVTSTVTVSSGVTLYGVGGSPGSNSYGSVIYQEDPSISCFQAKALSVIRGLRIQVNNTNLTSPVAGPPCIVSTESYPTIEDIRFEYAYIGVGSPSDSVQGAFFIRNLSGFVHHRMVYLKGTKDITYITGIHSQNPGGMSWDSSWYAYNNKVLVEVDDADGVYGSDWYTFAGRGLFKHSGTGNLFVTVNNAGAEAITHGIEIAAGSTNGQSVTFNGLYLQTNQRPDGVYLVSCEANVRLELNGFTGANSQLTDYVRVSDGVVNVTNSSLTGSNGSKAFRKYASGRLTVNGCQIRNHATVLHLEAGAENVSFGHNNFIAFNGVFANTTITGNQHIVIPSEYLDKSGAALADIVEYQPNHGRVIYSSGTLAVHKQTHTSVGQGADIVVSASNNNGPHVIGSRVRLRCYNTGATPGSESATAYIQPYSGGTYGNALLVSHTGIQGEVDNTQSCGTASSRWTAVYAATGTITTSDKREKIDAGTPFGLDFICELKPVAYRWKVGGKEVVSRDENGDPLEIRDIPGKRIHWGLYAQDVKEVMDRYGVDFAGWVLADKDDPESQQSLRYDQFIAPLIKAVQELAERVKALEAK